MFGLSFKRFMLTALLLVATYQAHATVITFDDFPTSDLTYLYGSGGFTSQGYNFSLTEGYIFFPPATPGYSTNGTTSLDLGGTVIVTSAANRPFSITSIDLATVAAFQTSTVMFTGIDYSGNKVVQSFILNSSGSSNPYALSTSYLNGFTDLVSFTMQLVSNPNSQITYFSFVDNIVINDTTDVPEPSSLPLFGLGFVLVGIFAHRRKFV